MIMRHRLNLSKLLFNKEGGYTLREFKKIYKREMLERPELYMHVAVKENQFEYVTHDSEESDTQNEEFYEINDGIREEAWLKQQLGSDGDESGAEDIESDQDEPNINDGEDYDGTERPVKKQKKAV